MTHIGSQSVCRLSSTRENTSSRNPCKKSPRTRTEETLRPKVNTARQRRLEKYCATRPRITYSESIAGSNTSNYKKDWFFIEDSTIFLSPDSASSHDGPHVPHQALNISSSKKPSREVEMPRDTQENMSIPGNVFDCVNMFNEILMN